MSCASFTVCSSVLTNSTFVGMAVFLPRRRAYDVSPPRLLVGGGWGRDSKRERHRSYPPARMVAAVFSATISTGMFRLAHGTVGIRDASHTRKPSTPITRALGSVTAMRSDGSPIRHDPHGCQVPLTRRRR